MMQPSFLTDFHSIRPQFESTQQATLDWIVAAHTQAEALQQVTPWSPDERCAFTEKLREDLQKVGAKPHVIYKRGHIIADFLHEKWDEMQVYRLAEKEKMLNLGERLQLHSSITDALFERLYADEHHIPAHMIHVSCTGYSSPSSGQKLVASKGWGSKTYVTHAYHMGCYGACPALRQACAFAADADVVHTEIPTLHFNPLLHTREQLVAQSLFADGFIKYRVTPEPPSRPSFAILALHEELIQNSHDAMKWQIESWGFQLSLAKELPHLIAQNVAHFIDELCKRAQVEKHTLLERGYFAFHPGGPKILDHLQKILGCQDSQMNHSREILAKYGNMSSATLPHIWQAILADSTIAPGTHVLSLAFGPGLTIAGVILQKRSA